MKRWMRFGSAALLMFAFSACGSLDDLTELEVVNQNNPDRERALSEAGDIESLVGSAFFTHHEILNGSPASALSGAGEEGSASWGNYGAQQLNTEPRVAWPNSPAWRYASFNRNRWYSSYEALSSVYDALLAIEAQPELCDDIDCDRAGAFAKYIQGVAHGWLALFYDKAFVFDETVDLQNDVLELVNYPNVLAASESYLETAASQAAAAGWSLPSSWIRGNPFTGADFARFIKAEHARILYLSPREPGEQTAAGWAKIVSLVDGGITVAMSRDGGYGAERTGIYLDGDPQTDWWSAMNYFGNATNASSWHRADYKAIGFYENDGSYSTWLAASLNDRNDFCLSTDDERVIGAACDADGLDFVYKGASPFPASRGTYFYSSYMNSNFEDYANGDQSTPIPWMMYRTQQLIKAEALAQQGTLGAAAAIVDVTRDGRGNLGAASTTDQNLLLSQIWYEYILENFYVHAGMAYFARRHFQPLSATGPNHHWGVVEGTPLHLPVPGKELEILQLPNYTYGGVGNEGGTLPASAPGMGRTVPASAIYQFGDLETMADKLDYILSDRDRPSSGVLSLVRH